MATQNTKFVPMTQYYPCSGMEDTIIIKLQFLQIRTRRFFMRKFLGKKQTRFW